MKASSGDGGRTLGVSKWVWFAGLIVLLVVVGAILDPASSSSNAPSQVERSVGLSGQGSGRTMSFELGGGTYRVEWKTQTEGTFGRFCMVSLGHADTGRMGPLLFSAEVQGHANGDTHVYGVEPGTYYFDVGDCGIWTITLATAS